MTIDFMPYSEWGNVFRELELLDALKADPMVLGIRATAGKFFIALDAPPGPSTRWAEDNLTDVLGVAVTLCEPSHPAYARAAHSLFNRPS